MHHIFWDPFYLLLSRKYWTYLHHSCCIVICLMFSHLVKAASIVPLVSFVPNRFWHIFLSDFLLWYYTELPKMAMLPSLPISIGWTSLRCRHDLFNLPTTIMFILPFLFFLMLSCQPWHYLLNVKSLPWKLASATIW